MQQRAFSAGRRPERAVLRIAGPEAQPFLHNLLTAGIERLQPGEATYAALLSPQGKILFDFFVFNDAISLLIDCSAAQKDDLIRRLDFYKLRAKITIGEVEDCEVGVSPEEPKQALRYADPRTPDAGWRMIAQESKLPESHGYEVLRIRLGLGDSDADLGSGVLFPHEANLDQLGAVNFDKGCYVGQEVVSRIEHRGTARSRILPVKLDGPAPPKGTEIKSGQRLIGTLLSSSGTDALALIRLDRLAEATDTLLTDSVRTVVQKPAWVRYDVPL